MSGRNGGRPNRGAIVPLREGLARFAGKLRGNLPVIALGLAFLFGLSFFASRPLTFALRKNQVATYLEFMRRAEAAFDAETRRELDDLERLTRDRSIRDAELLDQIAKISNDRPTIDGIPRKYLAAVYEDPRYQRIAHLLRDIQTNRFAPPGQRFDAVHVYLLTPIDEPPAVGEMRIYRFVASLRSTARGSFQPAGAIYQAEPEFHGAILRSLDTGAPQPDPVIRESYATLRSFVMPIFLNNRRLAFLGADFDLKPHPGRSRELEKIRTMLMILFLVSIVVFLISLIIPKSSGKRASGFKLIP